MKKSIDASQFSVFVFIAVMALKIFLAPGLLIKYSGRNGWISMLIFVLIELAVLTLILFIVKLNPGRSFYEILKDCVGKIVAKLVLGVTVVLLVVKLVIMIGELRLFFTTSILKSIDFTVCFLVLLFMLVIFSAKGLNPLARMAQLFFPFVLGALGILFFLTVGNIELSGLAPVVFDLKQIGGTLSKFPLWFGDVAVLLVFTGKVKTQKKFVLKSLGAAAISCVAVMYFAIVLFESYGDYPSIIDYGHNISNMVVYSSGSYLFGRFDMPIFCIWMISIFIQIIVSFFAIAIYANQIVEKGGCALWAIVEAVLLFVLCQFVFTNKSALFELGTGWARWLCLVVELLLPAALLVMSLVKKDKMLSDESGGQADEKEGQ